MLQEYFGRGKFHRGDFRQKRLAKRVGQRVGQLGWPAISYYFIETTGFGVRSPGRYQYAADAAAGVLVGIVRFADSSRILRD